MWYASYMPSTLPEDDIERAVAAVTFAQLVRRQHRRRTEKSSARRCEDIETALTRLREAMSPLRSEMGRFAYGPQTTMAEKHRQIIRDTSTAIQRERRKLWKMRSSTS